MRIRRLMRSAATASWLIAVSAWAVEGCGAETPDTAPIADAAADVSPDAPSTTADAAGAGDSGAEGGVPPRHVLTMDYGEGYVGKGSPYPPSAYPWLSFAEVGRADVATTFHENGVKTVKYTFGVQVVGGQKPDQPYWGDLGAAVVDGGAGESNPAAATFLHDCAGNALAGATEGNYEWYFVDWSNSATPAAYRSAFVGSDTSPFDYWFIDGVESVSSMSDVQARAPARPCDDGGAMSNATYLDGLAAGMAKVGQPVLMNSLGAIHWSTSDPLAGQPCDCISVAKATAGGRMEASFICPGNGEGGCMNQAPGGAGYVRGGPIWQAQENTVIQMANAHKLLVVQGHDNKVDPTTDTGKAHRLFYWASFFLAYDPTSTVAWYGAYGFGVDSLPTNPSGVRLYPESQVVMLDPVVPEPTNTDGIQALANAGAYGREYRDCYVDAVRIGSCAAAVNPDETAAHPFPIAGYGGSNPHAHQLVLHDGAGATAGTNGAEIVNGGTVTSDGGPAPASMASDTGVIVFDTSR